ncbi:hypothetical protein AgCh_001053 [Apium graveolens]
MFHLKHYVQHLYEDTETVKQWIVDNDLFEQDWRSRKKVQIVQYIVMKWTLVCLIGLSIGMVALFNNLAVENIVGFKLLLTSNLMLENRYVMTFVMFAGGNVALATCVYIAPAAAGRHPSVKWAHRSDVLFITVDLPDAKDVKLKLEPEGKFYFSPTSGPEKFMYSIDINLYDKFEEVMNQPNPSTDRLIRGLIAQLAKACTLQNHVLGPSMRSIVVTLTTLTSETGDSGVSIDMPLSIKSSFKQVIFMTVCHQVDVQNNDRAGEVVEIVNSWNDKETSGCSHPRHPLQNLLLI